MPQVSVFKVAVIPPHSSLGLINISEDHCCALMAGITQVQGVTTSTTLLLKPRGHIHSLLRGRRGPLKSAFLSKHLNIAHCGKHFWELGQ